MKAIGRGNRMRPLWRACGEWRAPRWWRSGSRTAFMTRAGQVLTGWRRPGFVTGCLAWFAPGPAHGRAVGAGAQGS